MSTSTNAALAWLQSGPYGIKDPAQAAKELATFEAPPTIGTITGPDVLVRAVGRNEEGKLASAYAGRYWVRQSTLPDHPVYRRRSTFMTHSHCAIATKYRE